MAGEEVTEREAALAARVKELEDAQAKGATTIAQGGVFEGIWKRITYVVPSWLAAAALAVLVAHYSFGYYLQSQITATETQLKEAKSDVETAKAEALNAPDAAGVSMRLRTLKVQLEKTTAEAAAARATANALNYQVNGETIALQKAKADLASIQNLARLKQAEADAASAKYGESTLSERAARAKLALQQLKTTEQNIKAAFNNAVAHFNGNYDVVRQAIVEGGCANNPLAEVLQCPRQFWQQNSEQRDGAKLASAPSTDNSSDWKARGACARDFEGFKRETIFGSFAVSRNGVGCAWGAGGGKSREQVRREALAVCQKSGYGECKIIGEKGL